MGRIFILLFMELCEIQVSYSNGNKEKLKITNSDTAYKVAISKWNMDTIELQEECKVLLLNRANKVIGIFSVTKGGTTSCIVDIKLILSVALKTVSNGIILLHNHPSGNLRPSEADRSITNKLKKGCEALDLQLLDHLIVTKEGYFSFSDSGELI